jgi:ribosome recycling factor
MDDIRKAILAANVGINPVPQGNFLRCPVPELLGERRREMIKVAHRMAEDGRVACVMRDVMHSRLPKKPIKKK